MNNSRAGASCIVIAGISISLLPLFGEWKQRITVVRRGRTTEPITAKEISKTLRSQGWTEDSK